MRIVLTGGGSGGHFYPLIAVAEEINKAAAEQKLVPPELFYVSDSPYDQTMLFNHNITFKKISTGKVRRYFSLLNITDFFKTIVGVIKGIFTIYDLYPDVIFSKGGYASFPAVMAGKIFKIPVFIHESDSVPGKLNKWAGTFATRIAVSYSSAATPFEKSKVALTGNPIRSEIMNVTKEGGYELTGLDPSVPVILVLGGSQGAQIINSVVVRALPTILEKFQVIHQTGTKNFDEINKVSSVVLASSPNKSRYKTYAFLDDQSLKMAAGIASLIISRAGSTIFEIAQWGIPSIIIPITETNGNHQRLNAYNYARAGACAVIEEENLSAQVLAIQVEKLITDSPLREQMVSAARKFANPNASKIIAREILRIALQHEK